MTIGPIQAFVIGFPDNNLFEGRIAEELARLSDVGQIRIIDAVFVMREDDDVSVLSVSDLDDEQRAELRSAVGALVGLGLAGAEGAMAGAGSETPSTRTHRPLPIRSRRGCWMSFRMAARRSCSRSSISGRYRCATLSATPAVSFSGTAPSPPRTSSRSGWTSATRRRPTTPSDSRGCRRDTTPTETRKEHDMDGLATMNGSPRVLAVAARPRPAGPPTCPG